MMDDEDQEETAYWDVKQSFILIGVDLGESMFVKQGETESCPFSVVLKACHNVADSLILHKGLNTWSQFAVALASEDPAKQTLVNFNDNLLESVKLLKKESSSSPEELRERYERRSSGSGYDLNNFFLHCKKKLTTINVSYNKLIFVFITNDDDPVKNNDTLKFVVLNEAQSFASSGIGFQLLTMRRDFRYDVFYNELLSLVGNEELEEIVEDEVGLTEKLSTLIVTKQTRRSLLFYPLRGVDDRYLQVVKFDPIKPERLLNDTYMTRTGKPVIQKMEALKELEPIDSTYMIKQFPNLVLTEEDRLELKQYDYRRGLTLVNVSRRVTDEGVVLSPSSLIEFDESEHENSKECKRFYQEMWNWCFLNYRVLVCVRKLTISDRPRYVELIPKYAHDKQLFLMKSIPWQEEVRDPSQNLQEPFTATEDQVNVTDKLIETLDFKYDPSQFPDVAALRRKAYVKSRLLDEPMVEVEDGIEETLEKIDEAVGNCLGKEYGSCFSLLKEELMSERSQSRSKPAAKRRKVR